MTIPTQEGFYWAQWRISDNDHELPAIGTWEVVEVFDNNGENENKFRVFVAGVEKSESLDNFVWMSGPLKRGVELHK